MVAKPVKTLELHYPVIQDLVICFIFLECGSLVNNSIKSPGYPNSYPNNIDCVYYVPIPYGMAMLIYFNDFELQHHWSCR